MVPLLHGHGKAEQWLGKVVVPLGVGAVRHGRRALRRGEAPDRRQGCGAGARHAASVETEHGSKARTRRVAATARRGELHRGSAGRGPGHGRGLLLPAVGLVARQRSRARATRRVTRHEHDVVEAVGARRRGCGRRGFGRGSVAKRCEGGSARRAASG